MSTIKVDTIVSENTPTVNFTDGVNVSGVATAHTILANNANISCITTATTFAPSEGQLAHRNVVINGAMEISQRTTSEASVAGGPAFTYNVVDRWVYGRNTTAVVTLSQAADAPTGFKYCYQLDVTTAHASPSYCRFVHRIEGNYIRRFGFGVAGTRYATLSFWHKHTKTGTNHVCIQNYANDRSYVAAYTQSTTNTWEKAVITFPIDTSGTWVTTNAGGLLLQWPMCDDGNASSLDTWIAGNAVAVNSSQVNNLDSTNNYFRLTGVQLELGSAATPFEHRDFCDDLIRCQRYYQKSYEYGTAPGTATNNGAVMHTLSVSQAYASPGSVKFPVQMRATPTMTIYSASSGTAGKINCDSTDGNGSAFGHSETGSYFNRSNDSGGSGNNVIARVQYTASAEL